MTEIPHPAASAEFLSRLHDGDVAAEERRAFETHRAACKACREAAEQYERTLSLYRAAAVGSTPADLSARILRKIRAQSPSRRPFGVTFGIDVRWAGALLAALLVVLVSAPLLLRRELGRSETASTHTIPAHLLDQESSTPETPRTSSAATAPQAPGPEPQRPGAQPPDTAGSSAKAAPRRQARGEVPAPEPAPAEKAASRAADALSKDESLLLRPRADEAPRMNEREAAGNRPASAEGAAASPSEGKLGAMAQRAPIRLSVRALDDAGSSPVLLARPPDDRLEALRGLEFVVVVLPGGTVAEVLPAPPPSQSRLRHPEAGRERTPDAAILRDLRFEAPGERRRLIVRID